MAADALGKHYAVGEIIEGRDCHSNARSVLGLIGYIACQHRPDACFAYVALSQHVANNFTPYTLNAIIRAATYLSTTKGL